MYIFIRLLVFTVMQTLSWWGERLLWCSFNDQLGLNRSSAVDASDTWWKSISEVRLCCKDCVVYVACVSVYVCWSFFFFKCLCNLASNRTWWLTGLPASLLHFQFILLETNCQAMYFSLGGECLMHPRSMALRCGLRSAEDLLDSPLPRKLCL